MEKNESTQKRKKGLETTRQILNISADLFARNGYDSVSVRKIAENAGIKESSLYNHFKSKADILERLFDELIYLIPQTRPSDEEIDRMLMFMEPEEIFKNIVFTVGKSSNLTLLNTMTIINNERFNNARAAEIYFKYLINEPTDYYERLITKMIEIKMIKPIDARSVAQQYNYVSNALTNEYLMAKYGYADEYSVVKSMINTLKFYCGLMIKDEGDAKGSWANMP
ncbi:MAG TPA: hypothetical protein DCS12_01085 [Clostridiales bacterium]|nr:hypothetical protein [Clostridiales bacterium]